MKYIAILRGINVGGKRKMPMAELKEVLTSLNYSDISTYIQSGNVAFRINEARSNSELESEIETSIRNYFQFDVPVIIRSDAEIEDILSGSEYANKYEAERLHYTFFKEKPSEENAQALIDSKFPPDSFILQNSGSYIYCSAGYSDTKFNNAFFEKKLKVECTTRNWRTMLKLQSMVNS